MKITCPIHQAAQRIPTARALWDSQRSFTFAETEKRIVIRTCYYRTLGLTTGMRVAILADNSAEYAITIFALQRLGVSFVPLNLRWSLTAWQLVSKYAGCVLILSDPEHAALAAQLNLPVFLLGSEASVTENESHKTIGQIPTTIDLRAESSVFFTSGSSGEPKGVILSYGNHYYNALGSNQNIVLQPEDCWLAALPFYHVGGISVLFRCALAGAAAAVIPQSDWEQLFTVNLRPQVTHVSLVPTQLARLLQSEETSKFLAGLKCILLGGAPLQADLLSQILERSLPVFTTYGLTETASQVTTVSVGDPAEKLATAGCCLPYRQVCILNEAGEPLPAGKVGEIAVQGEVLFAGYLGIGQPSKMGEWFCTGDLGTLDQHGYLSVRGRKDDLIISGGENIYPAKIENVARNFPGVLDCVVIGVDEPNWGQRPLLFVETTAPDSFPLAELWKYLRRRLVRILLPDRILVLSQLPKRSIGKVDKLELRRLASEKLGNQNMKN